MLLLLHWQTDTSQYYTLKRACFHLALNVFVIWHCIYCVHCQIGFMYVLLDMGVATRRCGGTMSPPLLRPAGYRGQQLFKYSLFWSWNRPRTRAILITKTRTKRIAIRLLKLKLELKYEKIKLYKNYIDIWLNELKRELKIAKYWNELKHVLVHVIFHVTHFQRDWLKRTLGQPWHLHYFVLKFRCSTTISPTEV